MAVPRILIVEDEQPIREMIVFHLSRAGYETLEAANCREARALLADHRPDLALVDWMLPDMSGLELTRMLKRDAEWEDYVTKPFSPRELLARIQAVLRRAGQSGDTVASAGVLEIDAAGHRVAANGREIRLGPTEYRLLHFLMTHPERVFSRAQLLDRVWGASVYVEERTVDVHIRRLRKALSGEGAEDYIQTVRGAGYRFSTRTS
jgi:two-component system, OmpR family, phosphate regulon response regulator PhoB